MWDEKGKWFDLEDYHRKTESAKRLEWVLNKAHQLMVLCGLTMDEALKKAEEEYLKNKTLSNNQVKEGS